MTDPKEQRRKTVDDFAVGESAECDVLLDDPLLDDFLRLSGDASLLHCDPAFARRNGFSDRVAPGALLVALASRLIGSEIPGSCGVLHSIDMKFHRPAYPGMRLTVRLEIEDISAAANVLILSVRVFDDDGGALAKGRARSIIRNA